MNSIITKLKNKIWPKYEKVWVDNGDGELEVKIFKNGEYTHSTYLIYFTDDQVSKLYKIMEDENKKV